MIDSIIKDRCTGCEGCASVCPTKCIDMVQNYEGFFMPQVNSNKCVNCKMCINICPVINYDKNHRNIVDKKTAYAFKSNNDEFRRICSSGAVFLSLATYFIEHDGIVYGASFDGSYNVIHKSATSTSEVIELAGSKYVQSRINDIYLEIKDKLEQEKKVIFFGTTCQVEGLRAYLGKNYSFLYCVDLICMGIPSPLAWDKYLDTYYKRSEIKKINFKDKSLGWHKFSFLLEKNNGTSISIPGFDNTYMQCMFKGYSIRKSCFDCCCKSESKIADITIADCWGCENYISELDDNKGLSMVICHSNKSDELIGILKEMGIVERFEYSNVLKYNSNYNNSTTTKKGRNIFYKLLYIYPVLAFGVMGKNPQNSFLRKVCSKIRSAIGD